MRYSATPKTLRIAKMATCTPKTLAKALGVDVSALDDCPRVTVVDDVGVVFTAMRYCSGTCFTRDDLRIPRYIIERPGVRRADWNKHTPVRNSS